MRFGIPRELPRRARALASGSRSLPQKAFVSFVRHSDDRRLERTFGSRRGLALLFGAMTRRFDPGAAEGFQGSIVYELVGMDGRTRTWTLEVGATGARAAPARAATPALTVRLGLSDLVRIAAGDLDPGEALLSGRLDLEGDVAVALRLGPMFGTGSGLGPAS